MKSRASIAKLKRFLQQGMLEETHPMYKALDNIGFEFQGMWINNPFWTPDGQFQVDPLEHYGDAFLNSKFASVLGYALPKIIPAHRDLLPPEQRRFHEASLMKKIMHRKMTEAPPPG